MIMPRGGRLLSPEETIRLAIVDSVGREKLIEHIVIRMRQDEFISQQKLGAKKVMNRRRPKRVSR